MGEQRLGPDEVDQRRSSTRARSPAQDEGSSGARWDDGGGHGLETLDVPVPATEQPGRLFLRGVLDSALPHELGTDAEPERYVVPAVFSRRVLPEERALIEGPATADRLAGRGYPEVGLKVADRRLEISRTNLAMLSGEAEAARAARVKAEAGRVRFE
jgi:hypothetical protein